MCIRSVQNSKQTDKLTLLSDLSLPLHYGLPRNNKIHDKEQTLHVSPCHGKYCMYIDKYSLCLHCIGKNKVNGLKERGRQQFWTPEVCTIVNVVR